MSTGTKRSLAQAREDAEAFRDLFAGTFERWTIAGSVRRGKAEIGDVDHVVIPLMADALDGTLFQNLVPVNLVWKRADTLLESAKIAMHHNGNSFCWGEKKRSIEFRGFVHEIALADAQNYGSVLAIRTGPADFSKALVSALHRPGCRFIQRDGYLRYKNSGDVYAVPTEEAYFKACGVPFLAPEKRLY